ncbi:aspartate aminotransferase family protein [Vibrio sp.]|uniref:aspartate aminotransferase family protein n=1 Tax=Vibrio sp. TaxID=678 RepID=UPI003D0BF8EB
MSMTNAFEPGRADLTPEEQQMVARRERLLGPAYRLFYEQPVHMVRGEGVWLYDSQDQAYLDCYNNVPSVGHCHPKVVETLREQAGILNTHTRYLHNNVLNYAEKLLSTFPEPLAHVMFTCTGSEANDLAYRIAKYHTQGTGFIVTDLAYHGGTDVIAALSPSLGKHVDLGVHVRTIPAPDGYRGNPEVGETFVANLRAAIADMQRHGIQPAALIVDSIFSSDGVFAEQAGFLREAAEVIRAAGGLYIADEVQSGFGRTGDAWWGFQRHDVVPDMVSLGKGMGAGHPIAGLVVRPELMAEFGRSRYFNTFGGNPVSCAVGQAVLEVIENESLIRNSAKVGAYMQAGLRQLAERYSLIGDIRGSGLFIGLELVKDRTTKEPATEETAQAVNLLRQKFVLISSAGPHANVMKIRPPLTFSKDNADLFLQRMEEVLETLSVNF